MRCVASAKPFGCLGLLALAFPSGLALGQAPPGYVEIDAGDRKVVHVRNITGGFLGRAEKINCSDGACAAHYRIESKKAPGTPVRKILSVTRDGVFSFTVAVSEPIESVENLTLVAESLEFGTAKPKPKRIEFPFAPTLLVGEGNRRVIVYHSPNVITDGEFKKMNEPREVNLVDTETGAEYHCRIRSVEELPRVGLRPASESLYLVLLNLSTAIPGGNLSVSIPGFPGEEVSGTFKVTALTKDKAAFYLSGQFVLNHVGEDSYAIEGKWVPTAWDLGRGWDLSPVLDLNVGATALKKPDTYHAALQAGHYWIGGDSASYAFVVSADYLTDKKLETQDGGGTLALLGNFQVLQRPLWMARELYGRRKAMDEKTAGSPPEWGYTIVPTLSVEYGLHVRSLSPDVEDHGYFRGRAALSTLMEFEKFTLDAGGELRYLCTSEVVLNNGTTIERGKGWKGYVRAEFGYALAEFLKLSAKHEWGNLPPTFKTTSATTLGLTVIY